MTSFFSHLNTVLNKIEKGCNILGGIALAVMMTIITLDALFRYLLSRPIPGVMEVTACYLSVIIVFLMLSYTYKKGGHVRVDMLANKFPPSVRRALDIIFGIAAGVLFILIAITGLQTGIVAFQEGSVPGGIVETPIWPGYIILTIGCLLLALRLILHALVLLLKRDDSDFIPEGRHPAKQDS